MLGVKKHKGWKYTKVSKMWTPLNTLFFFILLFMLFNFESIVLLANKQAFEVTEAEIIEETTDSMFYTLPMVRLRYNFKTLEFETDKLDLIKEGVGEKITIGVNKKAPNHIVIITRSDYQGLNLLLLIGVCISMGYFIKFLLDRHRQHELEFDYLKFQRVLLKYSKGELKDEK